MTEEEISMILNTFMYLNYKEAEDGMMMKEILADLSSMPDYQRGGVHYGEYQVLVQAAQNPQIAELKIGNQSHLLGYDSGTAACTFTDKDKHIYVVYRGTGDGEWLDNGIGMTESETTQQKRALDYFETIIESQQITEGERIIVTGHSKGGNKAQYVTMSTGYADMVDVCYTIDGQGFSEKAIEAWEKKWGIENYNERVNKITGICGENDYVNVLGNPIVKEENILYIKTPVKKEHFAGYHDIKYMFAALEVNPITGKNEYVFHGQKNEYVIKRGELGEWAKTLSQAMMKLPAKQRSGCAAFLMQLMELGGDKKSGLNGEKITLSDIEAFLKNGVPLTLGSLFVTREGNDLLENVFREKTFGNEMQGTFLCMAEEDGLYYKSGQLAEIAKKMLDMMGTIEELERKMTGCMKGSFWLQHKLSKEKELLLLEIKKTQRLADILKEVAGCYKSSDEKLADDLRMQYSFLLK